MLKLRGTTTKTLENFMGSKEWNIILLILKKKNRLVTVARSSFADVFLYEKGFFLWKENSEEGPGVKNLSTSSEVLEAIYQCGGKLTEKKIVDLIIFLALRKIAQKGS